MLLPDPNNRLPCSQWPLKWKMFQQVKRPQYSRNFCFVGDLHTQIFTRREECAFALQASMMLSSALRSRSSASPSTTRTCVHWQTTNNNTKPKAKRQRQNSAVHYNPANKLRVVECSNLSHQSLQILQRVCCRNVALLQIVDELCGAHVANVAREHFTERLFASTPTQATTTNGRSSQHVAKRVTVSAGGSTSLQVSTAMQVSTATQPIVLLHVRADISDYPVHVFVVRFLWPLPQDF